MHLRHGHPSWISIRDAPYRRRMYISQMDLHHADGYPKGMLTSQVDIPGGSDIPNRCPRLMSVYDTQIPDGDYTIAQDRDVTRSLRRERMVVRVSGSSVSTTAGLLLQPRQPCHDCCLVEMFQCSRYFNSNRSVFGQEPRGRGK